jgi:hypothetical protein
MKIIITAFLIFSSYLFSESDTEKIEWRENVKLSWADFKGVPNRGAGYVASASSGISFSYSFKTIDDELFYHYKVECHFYPQESWYKPELVSNYILKHEQTHFDITELHARMLRKRLSESKFSKNIKVEIEGIYKTLEKQRGDMQNRFDAETEHSKNKQQEYLWEAFISKQLKAYDRWK